MMHPDTYITQTDSSIRGRIQQIKSPYIRFAPGLSLKFSSALPYQSSVFKDGDNQLVLYNYEPLKKTIFQSLPFRILDTSLHQDPIKSWSFSKEAGRQLPALLHQALKKSRLSIRPRRSPE
jgi:hypothetical protein